MTMTLDENQQKAVEHFQGPALVVAGPGSGKTTVIKERILHLIREHNVDPEQILAIAFTNAAADEMKDRLTKETLLNQSEPKICTLHTFGKDLITNHYEHELLKFSKEPDIWAEKKIRQVINREKGLLDRETRIADVAIYKIEDTVTGQCYIGQTTDPIRRKEEHFDHSSNRGLYEALQKGDEQLFDFDVIEWVKGSIAYPREKYWIDYYRDRSVFNLVHGIEQVASQGSKVLVTIYKIKSLTGVTAYIGYTTDPESICKIIENEQNKRFTFEVIRTEVPWTEASTHIANEIKDHKNWAVFNREDPEKARYSNQLRIEVFCEYFDVPYEEVLAHPEKFENLMERFDDLKEDIEKEKQQVNTGLFDPNKIADPVLRAFAKRYEERRKEADAIDFLDMLIYSAYLLENDPILHQYYRDKHRYVFVDEFQDISPIDFRLIDLFSKNLFAVGDDDQAIYGFRGGDSSIMQEKFRKRRNVSQYKITCNYRSTSTIVRHAKSLIENNPDRIRKKLYANNSVQSQVEVLETSKETVKAGLLKELFNLLTTDFQKIGILARNWRGEINEIQEILKSSKLDKQGFEIDWKELDDLRGFSDNLDNQYVEKSRRIMFLRRGTQEIEVLNIHTAKGREWDKVILLVNTLYESLPDNRNDPTEERRLFYVAITRAKQELVVLDGGNCQFIPEFRNAPPMKEEWEEAFRAELATQEPKLKKELEEASETLLIALESRLEKQLEKGIKVARERYAPEINRLKHIIMETQDEARKWELTLLQQLKSINDAFLEDLIPVLDAFESQIKNLPAAVESNNQSDGFAAFTQNVQLAQTQLLNLLKGHELKPIDTSSGSIFNPVHHEKLLPAIYSTKVPIGRIVREEQRGYLLHDSVVRKAKVVLSKGQHRADTFLCKEFPQPVTFATYAGLCNLSNIQTFRNEVNGHDLQGEVVQLQNLNVLFAFPKEDMTALRSHIKRRRGIVNQKLQPLQSVSKRYRIEDDFLKSLIVKRDAVESENQASIVQLVTRSGHVLSGLLWDFDENFIYMNINKKVVIVYRAGIRQFEQIWNEIAEAHKEDTPIDGYVTKQVKDGLQVRFRSLHGFLPKSQVEIKTIRNLGLYVRKTLRMKVTKLSKSDNNIVFSRRALLEEERMKLFNAFREIPEEPLTVRNIKRTSKTVEPIPEPNGFPLVPKAKRIPVNKLISVIVPEPVEEMIDTSPPTSIDFTESLDTCAKNLKPEPPPIEIDPDPLETINSNPDPTLPGYDFVREQRRAIRSETLEPVEPTTLTRSDSFAEIDNDAPQIAGQISEKNKVEDTKKSLGYYLSRGGRFAVEKIKTTLFKKPNS